MAAPWRVLCYASFASGALVFSPHWREAVCQGFTWILETKTTWMLWGAHFYSRSKTPLLSQARHGCILRNTYIVIPRNNTEQEGLITHHMLTTVTLECIFPVYCKYEIKIISTALCCGGHWQTLSKKNCSSLRSWLPKSWFTTFCSLSLLCCTHHTTTKGKKKRHVSSHIAYDSGFKCMIRQYKLSTSGSLQLLKRAHFCSHLYCVQYLSLAVQSFTVLPALMLI